MARKTEQGSLDVTLSKCMPAAQKLIIHVVTY